MVKHLCPVLSLDVLTKSAVNGQNPHLKLDLFYDSNFFGYIYFQHSVFITYFFAASILQSRQTPFSQCNHGCSCFRVVKQGKVYFFCICCDCCTSGLFCCCCCCSKSRGQTFEACINPCMCGHWNKLNAVL